MWTGRLGVPVVLEPDVTAGVELGAAAVWHFLAGLGIYAELIGSLFFGAATLDKDRTRASDRPAIIIDWRVIASFIALICRRVICST